MNRTSLYKLCIIIPLYNEEGNIHRLEKELSAFKKQTTLTSCVLFINDCSTDGSLSLIKDICQKNSDFYYISFSHNKGLSAAIKAGIDYTGSEYVGYIDADLQTTPEDFNLLIPHITNYEMVMGIRTGRKDRFVKKISSKIANGFRRMITKDGIEDTGCPLKIINTNYAKRIPLFNGMHRFLPALIQLQNGNVKQIPVRHFERIAGKSKYHLWNRLLGPLNDCFAFRWMKKRYISYNVESGNIQKVNE